MIPPHKYQKRKVRSADAAGAGKFPAGFFGQVGFAYRTCHHGFKPTWSWGARQSFSSCTTEFTDVAHGQGARIPPRESSSGAQGSGPAAIRAPHSRTRRTQSSELFIPEQIQRPRRGSLKSMELHLVSFHLHRGSALTRVGGEARGTRRARSPLGSAPNPAPRAQPRKTGL